MYWRIAGAAFVSKWYTVGGNTGQSARVQAVCDCYGPIDFDKKLK